MLIADWKIRMTLLLIFCVYGNTNIPHEIIVLYKISIVFSKIVTTLIERKCNYYEAKNGKKIELALFRCYRCICAHAYVFNAIENYTIDEINAWKRYKTKKNLDDDLFNPRHLRSIECNIYIYNEPYIKT